MEVEYVATCDAVKKAIWMRMFIVELEMVPSIELSISLYCDNNEAIAQAREPKSYQKSKHIQWRFHLIREIIACGDVQVQKIASLEIIVNPLAKALPLSHLDHHLVKMGIRYLKL